MSKPSVPTQRRYPPELRERAVRVVKEAIAESGGEHHGVVTRIAIHWSIGSESLCHWVKQAPVDGGLPPGVTTEERRRIGALERDVSELLRANGPSFVAVLDWEINEIGQSLLDRAASARWRLANGLEPRRHQAAAPTSTSANS